MIGGGIAVNSVTLLDKLRIDDPVGAISVHGFTGLWVSYTCQVLLLLMNTDVSVHVLFLLIGEIFNTCSTCIVLPTPYPW